MKLSEILCAIIHLAFQDLDLSGSGWVLKFIDDELPCVRNIFLNPYLLSVKIFALNNLNFCVSRDETSNGLICYFLSAYPEFFWAPFLLGWFGRHLKCCLVLFLCLYGRLIWGVQTWRKRMKILSGIMIWWRSLDEAGITWCCLAVGDVHLRLALTQVCSLKASRVLLETREDQALKCKALVMHLEQVVWDAIVEHGALLLH